MTLLLASLFAISAIAMIVWRGAPLIDRVADARLRTNAPLHIPERRDYALANAPSTIVPLDLGEDTMRWPSERGGRDDYEDKLSWPSTHWTDGVFGRDAPSANRTSTSPPNEAEVCPLKPRNSPSPFAEPEIAHDVVEVAPAPQLQPQGALRPSQDEIKALIQSKGLAGTVRHLTRTTDLTVDQVTALILNVGK